MLTGPYDPSNYGNMAGYGSTPAANASEYRLPTTAGEISSGGVGAGSGSSVADSAQGRMDNIFADNLEAYNGRNGWGKTFFKQDGSFDLGSVGTIAKGIGGLGQLWLGFQANKTAKKALKLQTRSFETNLANQISSYNTALDGRATAAAAQNNAAPGTAETYFNKHKL